MNEQIKEWMNKWINKLLNEYINWAFNQMFTHSATYRLKWMQRTSYVMKYTICWIQNVLIIPRVHRDIWRDRR